MPHEGFPPAGGGFPEAIRTFSSGIPTTSYVPDAIPIFASFNCASMSRLI